MHELLQTCYFVLQIAKEVFVGRELDGRCVVVRRCCGHDGRYSPQSFSRCRLLPKKSVSVDVSSSMKRSRSSIAARHVTLQLSSTCKHVVKASIHWSRASDKDNMTTSSWLLFNGAVAPHRRIGLGPGTVCRDRVSHLSLVDVNVIQRLHVSHMYLSPVAAVYRHLPRMPH